MRYLTLGEVLTIHHRVMEQSGGMAGVGDVGALESAIAQPRMTFAENDLYPTIADKAAALGFSIIQNHPFVDGNKRTGHAAMETFLYLNQYEIVADMTEQYEVILSVASSRIGREEFIQWLRKHIVVLDNS